MTKCITFVLPQGGKIPIGGFKVVYEYANNLVSRGYKVNIIHSNNFTIKKSVASKVRSRLGSIRKSINKSYMPTTWFTLDRRVNAICVPSLEDEKYIPDADVIIATMWWTSEFVAGYSEKKGEKYYLIQHYEDWFGDEERLIKTWQLPLHKIVIARWLAEVAEELNETYTYIPNGLDFSKFNMDIPIESRNKKNIMMLYHEANWKGSADGLQALSIAKRYIPDLTVNLFGVPAGDDLPNWVNYHRIPSQDKLRDLYNQAAIFLAPSWSEGWGLPPAEAMMSGAAVVATDIGGHKEFLENNITGCLVPVQRPDVMADTICDLIRDDGKRIMLATAGAENIRQFTWARATTSLIKTIER